MEYWSIEKIIRGCEVFHKPSLYNASIRDQIVLPPLQHSITPILHKPYKFQETKSPLGITKAGSFGPGFRFAHNWNVGLPWPPARRGTILRLGESDLAGISCCCCNILEPTPTELRPCKPGLGQGILQ